MLSIDIALQQLEDFLAVMEQENGGYFSYHLVSDKNMRNNIEHTLALCKNAGGQFGEKINGRNIFIIDDTISRGATIRQSVELIKETFTPKSITVLTMFSALGHEVN